MKLIKKLLAMALAGVMLLTVLTGCSGGKTGDRLVEEYIATYLSETFGLGDIPITHDVPEIKTVAENFDPSWLNDNGKWNISSTGSTAATYTALQEVFSKYSSGYTVNLYAREVDSTQSELYQTMRVMATMGYGLRVYPASGLPGSLQSSTAIQCATRLVTRGDKSYRIAVIIYDYAAG